MNDPSKIIDVDKSSLLSLKAELLRKQEEVSRANNNRKLIAPKQKSKLKQIESKTSQNNDEYLEDSAMLNKSKKTLEAKAKFYDKMVSGQTSRSIIDENCLVNFERKRLELSDDEDLQYASESKDLDQNLWVEYTDSLGRSRVCLKKDLSSFVQQDKDLNVVNFTEKSKKITISKTINLKPVIDVGLKFQEQRDKWEKQEVENSDKVFLNYQDVLFDEARTHGTGYYHFDTDQEKRTKQQEQLKEIRDYTLEAQQKRESLRNVRDKVIADRVTAARARVRARFGLPEEENVSTVLYDKSAEEKNTKLDEIQSLKRIKEEKRREEDRKNHVRPWDKGKSNTKKYSSDSDDSDNYGNIEWEPKKEFEPMSQQQWNDRMRSKRYSDFAPPVYESSIPKDGKQTQENKTLPEITEDDINIYLQAKRSEKSLIFSSKTKPQFKRKNYEPTMTNDVNEELLPDKVPKLDPSTSSAPLTGVSNEKLELSIAAGLRFLRNKSDKGEPKNKNSWASRKEY